LQGKKQNISMQKEFGQYDEKLVKIIEKSTELFGEYGVRNLNMDEISKGIGISKKTLYQFVCSKEDLLEKIFHYEEEKWQQLPSKIKEDELNAIDVLLQTSLLIYEELRRINPKVDFELKKYYKPVFNKFLSRRLDSIFFYISNNLKKGMGEGLYRNDLNVELIARVYVKNLVDLQNKDYCSIEDFSFEQVFKTVFENHIRAISSPEGIAYFEKRKLEFSELKHLNNK